MGARDNLVFARVYALPVEESLYRRDRAEWILDRSVRVRTFNRTVRVDGLYLKVKVLVVRRKI